MGLDLTGTGFLISVVGMKKSIISLVLALAVVFSLLWVNAQNNDAVANAPVVTSEEVVTEVAPEVEVVAPVEEPAAPGDTREKIWGGWASIGGGCNTRHLVLQNTLADMVLQDGSDCKPVSGTYVDPYTDTLIAFTLENAGKSPVDHVMSVSEAYDLGAYKWTKEERVAFYNDPENLVLTSVAANAWKSDKSLVEILDCVEKPELGCAPTKFEFTGTDFLTERYVYIAEKYNLNTMEFNQ